MYIAKIIVCVCRSLWGEKLEIMDKLTKNKPHVGFFFKVEAPKCQQ